MRILWLAIYTCVSVLSTVLSSDALGQTEVLTVQGNLPRLNYRDTGGNLIWAVPANSVLFKLDGPFNAGVIVVTAAAPSNSMVMNEGGVSIRGGGFPSAKLHVGSITSVTDPGEVRVDPGNPAAATIHAVNSQINTSMILETQAVNRNVSLKMANPTASFTQAVTNNFALRDNINNVNPIVVFPSASNINSVVIRNGRVGLGVANPASPLQLANGASCSVGGVWTNASSRELKQGIAALSLEAARDAVRSLKPVTYAYTAEPNELHAGFIAEDVPDLVAMNSRRSLSSMDFVAVLTKVVQVQEEQLDSLYEELDAQKELLEIQALEIANQSKQLSQQEARLNALAKRLDEISSNEK